MIKKIGIMTGGGDCPGLNAVIRAIVKPAINNGYEVIGYRDGYRGLVVNNFMKITSENVSGILDRGGTILGTSNRDNPFNFKVEKDGEFEFRDMSSRVINNLSMFGVDALIVIGGDGTLTSARDFSRLGVKVIGVPKTIDNDLFGTDMTFGFMTAVETATEAIDKLHSTAESHHRVMILEVMGRYAGWIALHSGIAGGADVILIPEIPYDINKVAKAILKRKNVGKSFSIVVVAEGAKEVGGDVVAQKIIEDSPDPIRLGGIGNIVAVELERLTGIECRVTVLGHLQRGGRPTPNDRILSTRFGVAALELIKNECFGEMVCLKGGEVSHIPLEEALCRQKLVNPEGGMANIARNLGVSFGE